jgi:hypothetical protein
LLGRSKKATKDVGLLQKDTTGTLLQHPTLSIVIRVV